MSNKPDDETNKTSPRWSFLETSRSLIIEKKETQGSEEKIDTTDNLLEMEPNEDELTTRLKGS